MDGLRDLGFERTTLDTPTSLRFLAICVTVAGFLRSTLFELLGWNVCDANSGFHFLLRRRQSSLGFERFRLRSRAAFVFRITHFLFGKLFDNLFLCLL